MSNWTFVNNRRKSILWWNRWNSSLARAIAPHHDLLMHVENAIEKVTDQHGLIVTRCADWQPKINRQILRLLDVLHGSQVRIEEIESRYIAIAKRKMEQEKEEK